MTSLGQTASAGLGRVSWRRFTLILLPTVFMAVLLPILTAHSAFAVSLNISGTPFTVTAAQLDGQGFEQFGTLSSPPVELSGKGQQIPLAVTAMRSATISHLCQSVNVGGVPMIITAGDGSTPATATNLVVYANRLSGDASFEDLTLGQDAGSLHEVPGVRGPAGAFALQATSVTISNLRQNTFATTSSSFTLPGFLLQFGGSC